MHPCLGGSKALRRGAAGQAHFISYLPSKPGERIYGANLDAAKWIGETQP
jgi:hypothetical protein